MTVLLATDVPVHYGFLQICVTDADQPGHAEACAGQRNGLCGGAVRDVLALVTGLHTGRVPLVVEWHDAEPPPPDPSWEEVVEVPFSVSRRDLTVASFGSFIPVRLPRKGRLRARFCASGMDEAQHVDTITGDLPTIDRYLVALWPAEPAPEAILRQTSRCAAHWHQRARETPAPVRPSRAQIARAERRQAELLLWGGRPPSPRLRALTGSALAVADSHRDLLDTFDALSPGSQRATAGWLARRACEVAGIDQLDWAGPGLDALDRGDALPPPFTDPTAAFRLVASDARATFALSAIFSATDPDPLQAVAETFGHALTVAGDREADLVSELERHLRP